MGQLKTSLILDLVDRMSKPAARARGQLKKIQDTAAKIDGFRKLSKQTAETSKKMKQAQARVAALAVKMKKAKKPSKQLQASFASAKKESSNLKKALSQQSTKLHLLRRDLADAGVKTKQLGRHQRELSTQTDRLTRKIKRLNAAGRLANTARGFGGSMLRASKAAGRGVTRYGKAAVKGVGVAVAAATGSAVAFNRLFVGTAATFEKYKVQLEALEGSSEKAKKSMDWVGTFATKTPFQIDGVMNAFVRLRSFGMDPMNGTLQSIADQTAKLGGVQQELEGIILAVGQAWTKGKLQGEEALQLIERGVPVWDLLSKATGRSTEELINLSSKGKLTRESIKLLINEMGRSSQGAAAAQMKTWNGMISNLGDQWTRFVNMVMDAGAFDAIKGKLASVLETVNKMAADGRLKKVAENLSKNVIRSIETISSLGRGVLRVFDNIDRKLKIISVPLSLLGSVSNFIGDKVVNPGIKLTDQTYGKAFGFSIRDSIDNSGVAKTVRDSYLGAPIELTDGAKQAKSRQPGPVDNAISQAVSQVTGLIKIQIDSEGRAKVKSIDKQAGGVDFSVDTGLVMVGN